MKENPELVGHHGQQSQAVRLAVNLSINLSAVKPEPPLNLHLEMTEKGEVRICWADPVLMPYPLQYEVNISGNAGPNGWQVSQLSSVPLPFPFFSLYRYVIVMAPDNPLGGSSCFKHLTGH